jgi:glycerol-3-phosphate dehydrogenase
VLDRCFAAKLLPRRAGSATAYLPLVGAPRHGAESLTQPPGDHLYGTDVEALHALPGAKHWLWGDADGGLSDAMVRFAARTEMARTVEDVLARRSRLLFLDAAQASAIAEPVAALLHEEIGGTFDARASAQSFKALAVQYLTLP